MSWIYFVVLVNNRGLSIVDWLHNLHLAGWIARDCAGCAPEEENRRYEEQRADGVRYRIPGKIPEEQTE